MKKFLLAAVCLLLTVCGFTQGTLKGRLVDAETKKPLYLATVTVYRAIDTSLITYRLAADDGVFKVPGLPLNTPLRMVATFTGYEVMRKEFTLLSDSSTFDADSVFMTANNVALDEVLVIAERPPMTVRKDTVEFNAASFKMLPNALVEDLLRKLPGVQVDKDGNITVHGKRVNRITVDGKTFFGDDPKMASRNLPSNVIDKVQVTDDKEEMLQNGDDNTTNVGKVINLTFKKGVKKGVFGKAYAGGGSNGRYEAGAIANTFRDTLQVSLLGYTNNLNRPGFSFSELMQTGGISRSSDVGGSRNTSIWNNGNGTGIKINDIHFGGITEYGGISTSSGLGINLNHSPSKKQSIFAQYFYGNVKVDAINNGYTSFNSGDTILTRSERDNNDVVINAHNIGLGAKLKPDSVTSIIAQANYMTGRTLEDRNSILGNTSTAFGNLSDGSVAIDRNKLSKNYTHFLNYNKLSRIKKGRRFNLRHDLAWRTRDNGSITNSLINYYYPVAKDSSFDQLRSENITTLTANVSANYSEPIVKNLWARVDAVYNYESLTNTIKTFGKDGSGEYGDFKSAWSNRFDRTSNQLSASAGIEYKYKKLTVTPRVRYQTQHFANKLASLPNSVDQRLNKLLPELSIQLGSFYFNYRKQIILPAYRYLIPVFDNTNPYVINNGNPNLLPAVKHGAEINMYNYNLKLMINTWGWMRAETMSNDVIENIIQQPDGTQFIVPINADGSRLISGNAGIDKQNKFSSKFTMTNNVGFWYQYKESFFSYNSVLSKQRNQDLNLWGGANFNWNDVVEWNNSVSFGLSKVRNSNTDNFRSYNITNYTITSEQVFRWPKHIIWENSLSYTRNSAIVDPSLRSFLRWNAAINITMLKNDAGVLRIGAYDLLRQINSTNVQVTKNMLTYRESNIIGNYYMATFTYNMRPNGAKKKVGGSTMFLF